jgi:hypothetical protein
MSPTDTMDWWLQRTAVYGLAFVFTAAVLLILVYIAWSVVKQFNRWLPRWFEASIAKQERDSATLERIERCMERQEKCTARLVESSTSVRQGLRDVVLTARRAFNSKEMREQLKLDPDVLGDLDQVAGTLSDRRQEERYTRYERLVKEQQHERERGPGTEPPSGFSEP